MSDELKTATADHADVVPAELPAMRTDIPQPVRAITGLSLLPATLLFWFFPKRLGAVLSAAGWRAAIMAHLVGTILGLGMIFWALLLFERIPCRVPGYFTSSPSEPQASMTLAEFLRAPLVSLAAVAHACSGSRGYHKLEVAVVLGEVPVLLLVAASLMSSAAAGERLRPLYGRCLRLTLWSTTMLIPLGVGAVLWLRLIESCGLNTGSPGRMLFGIIFTESDGRRLLSLLAAFVFILWWLTVLNRSAQQYAGPPDGPGWERRRPKCLKCGYIISLLPLEGKCPECGHPVRDSLTVLAKACQFSPRKAYRASVRAALASLRRRER